MQNTLKIIFVLGISFVLIMTTGCATQKTAHSGFLESYPVFEPGPKDGVDSVYLKRDVDFTSYNKIMMDHVVFYLSKDAKYKGIHADEMKELADAFHKAFAEALGNAYPLVDKPGKGVLRIRTAITDLVPSKPGLSGVTTVVPIGLAIDLIKSGAGGGHTGVGQASMEVEFLDSITNVRVAAAIDTKPGNKLEGFTKWGAAKGAFEFWAKRLRIWLDQIHEKNQNTK
jgi:hypothetical protein